ncbi:MAG: beta-galactosidase [Verrucomicrobiae bacterium]|nr:beta-galactosidase [Verrucomicrobiae bacterium]
MKTKTPENRASRTIPRRAFLRHSIGTLALACVPLTLQSCSTTASRKTVTAPAQQPLYWAWWGWEPLDHYRRTGGIVGAVDTSSPWLEQWYDRLHSEEIVTLMANLGINLGITHFFKGFGLVHERPEIQRTAQLLKLAHRHGIKMLGYCQSRSIYHEQFLAEVPDAKDWIQRDEHGQLRLWGNQKFRWAPCINSRQFRDYLKRVITVGLAEIRLDGLHFDNNYAPPCYCQHCEENFRAWLKKRFPNPKTRFGCDNLDHIRQPILPKNPDRITDPLLQEWLRWRCETLAEYQAELKSHARRIKPDVILLGNPGFPRRPTDAHLNSIWAPWLGRHLDLMFAENGNFPGIENGAMISQVRAYKYATAVGYRVLSTPWQRTKQATLGRLPDTPNEVALQIAEAAANNAVPGTNWALRPLGAGPKMRIERSDLRNALAKYLRFLRAHQHLWQNARPVTDIALLHTFASTVFDNAETVPLTAGAEEILIRAGLPWEVLFDEHLNRLKNFSLLILAAQSHLSDQQIRTIQQFVHRGGHLILIGQNGHYDQYGRPRPNDPFARTPAQRLQPDLVRPTDPSLLTPRVTLPQGWKEVADTIANTAGDRLSARLLGTDSFTLNAYTLADRLIIHIVNYSTTADTAPPTLQLGRHWKNHRTAKIITPDSPLQTVPLKPTIQLPPFPIYAIIEILP